MNPFDLVVRRSALLMWLLAVTGVPFIIFGVDILFERRLATTLTDLIYPGENVTPPPFETHDLAWAWVLLIVGGAMTVWALKELIAPRRVLQADHRGVALAVAGPFTAAVRIPWTAVEGVERYLHADEGGGYEALRIEIAEPERLPRQPWGARWADDGALLVAANEWDVGLVDVVARLTAMREEAEQAASHQTVDAPVVWHEDQETDDEL